MERNIQVRHVPEELHRTLKARAARAGMTLSDYVIAELEAIARTPTIEELFERVRTRAPVHLETSSARAVRAERESRR